LAGLSARLLNRLQSVLNAAARSIAGLRRSDHITDALVSVYWPPAPEHIMFKLSVIVQVCSYDNESKTFDAELVEIIIKKLKRGKAAGLDGVTAEHLQYSHPK